MRHERCSLFYGLRERNSVNNSFSSVDSCGECGGIAEGSARMKLEEKRRRRLLAGVFSMFIGGLGQLYNGEEKKAGFIFLIDLLLFFSLFFVFQSFSTCVGFILFGLLFRAWSVGDAILQAGKPLALRWYNRWYYYLLFVIATLGPSCAIDLHAFVEAFKIPSSSMAPSLIVGDCFMADKRWYRTHEPQRGEIVVFPSPEDPASTAVKRVIGIAGDAVELRGTHLFMNGKEVVEPYAVYKQGGLQDFPLQTVPAGPVFLLGDNRDQSKDARFWQDAQGKAIPFVSTATLKGKATYIYFNSTNFSRIGTTFP